MPEDAPKRQAICAKFVPGPAGSVAPRCGTHGTDWRFLSPSPPGILEAGLDTHRCSDARFHGACEPPRAHGQADKLHNTCCTTFGSFPALMGGRASSTTPVPELFNPTPAPGGHRGLRFWPPLAPRSRPLARLMTAAHLTGGGGADSRRRLSKGDVDMFVTQNQLAREMQVGRRTLWRLLAEDPDFPRHRLGPRTLRFNVDEVQAYLRERRQALARPRRGRPRKGAGVS